MKYSVHTGDLVQIIAGNDKGKRGKIIKFHRSAGKLKVEGMKLQTCFIKEKGTKRVEGWIDVSNVKLIEQFRQGEIHNE